MLVSMIFLTIYCVVAMVGNFIIAMYGGIKLRVTASHLTLSAVGAAIALVAAYSLSTSTTSEDSSSLFVLMLIWLTIDWVFDLMQLGRTIRYGRLASVINFGVYSYFLLLTVNAFRI